MIPYGRQWIDDNDIAAVVDVLRGDWLTQGPSIAAFEEAVAALVEVRHAIAFSSCTAALHGACAAADLGPGSRVVTSPLTFMASANCARYVGATPSLVDIDPTTWNLNTSTVPPSTDAVVAVHYAGLPVDLAAPGWPERPRFIIEDAAHALGAMTPDGPVGNCANSDMCCFSFHPVKPITSAEGGMVTTNDDELADRLRRFRSHGIIRKPDRGGWVYDIADLGYHYRMTDMQAALGLSQLAKLRSFVDRRNALAARYRERLADLPVVLPPPAPDGFLHGYHIFPVGVPHRRAFYDQMIQSGIGVQVHYVPIHHHSISLDIEMPENGLPQCDALYEGLLSIPLFPAMTETEQDLVIDAITRCVDSIVE